MATDAAVRGQSGVYVGKDLGFASYPISAERVAWFMETIGDVHPWYVGDSPFGGPVAPALLYHNPGYERLDGWYLPHRYGNLHAKQAWEFFQPAPVGSTLRGHAFVADRYLKRDRDFVVMECTLFDEAEQIVARARSTQSFLADTNRTGIVVDREREKRPDRTFTAAEQASLEDVTGRRVEVTAEVCDLFVGGRKNYHNDAAEAEKLGFKEVVVQGTLSSCFMAEMMTHRFGAGFFRGGRLALTFVNVLWAGEAMTPRAAVRSRVREGDAWRLNLDVWAEKDDGTKTIVGTASALEL